MLRLEMLPADYGDCLWLEYGEPGATRVVIIDGGPDDTYDAVLRPRIECRHEGGRGTPRIELLVVTHIDNDHIVGALKLLQDPSLEIDLGEVWFNGWEQIVPPDEMGVKEGVALSKAIQERGINHNTAFEGSAAAIPAVAARKYELAGGLNLTILSPGLEQLKRLKSEWDDVVAEAAKPPEPSDLLGGTTKPDVKKLAAKPFTSDTAVANGSSIALLAEYGQHRVLLAADSFATVVANSLRHLGFSETNRVQLAAYKISHHGSRGNNSRELLRLVQCSNYLFSTSGARFHHPHDECVARVLVDGGKRISIHTNYRRDTKLLWDRKDVAKIYNHRVVEPKQDDEGSVIVFP